SDPVADLAASTGVAPSVESPRMDLHCNVLGLFNVLEGARGTGVTSFVFASSSASVGEVTPPIHEGAAPSPVSPYGASKLAGEGYCSAYFQTYGLKTVALRFGNVYGPLSVHKDSVVARFFKRALAGKPLEIYGDGTQTRDFIFIEDLVDAILSAVRSDVGGEVFQIATNRETTVNEIARLVKGIVEEHTGEPVELLHGSERSGDVKRSYSDISKARQKLGWEPRFTIEQGLRATFQYFISEQ
ncbi:GDP-mannose 4,6-dehydratase, partial [Planctomycetota bacterium]